MHKGSEGGDVSLSTGSSISHVSNASSETSGEFPVTS
jgi:hypothetical protein